MDPIRALAATNEADIGDGRPPPILIVGAPMHQQAIIDELNVVRLQHQVVVKLGPRPQHFF